jgi:hypothetical protein
MKMTMQIDGLDQLLRGFESMPAATRKRVKKRFGDVAIAAAERIAPKVPTEPDGGFLKASVRAGRAVELPNGVVSSSVIAGGDVLRGSPALEGHKFNVYAVVQNEDTSLRHDDGQSQFMQAGATEAAGTLLEDLEGDIDDAAKEAGLAG